MSLLTLLAAGVGGICFAVEEHPPIYGATGNGATALHTHIPPDYLERSPCIIDWYSGEEATGTRYQAWHYAKTLQFYRIDALLRYSSVEDLDWRQDWDPQEEAYGDPYTIPDGSLYITNDLFRWEGADQLYFYSPPGPGTITYRVKWWDNNDPEGTHDADVWDNHPISVVNNTYPGWSYIATGSRYLSKRELYDSVAPPTPMSVFDGGREHIRVGDELWVTECRHVRSYTVDAYTGVSTVARIQELYGFTYYFYGDPADDDPNHLPGHLVRSTLEPGYWEHVRDHAGLPQMLTPPSNPSIMGSLCVVKGSVTVDDPLPRKTGDPPVDVVYEIQPLETELAPVGDPVVIEIWDPAPAEPGYSYRKKWTRNDLGGTISWDGKLDKYDGEELVVPNEQRYCQASAVFGKITVKVQDRCWMWGAVQIMIDEFEFEMPAVSIIAPVYDSLFPVGNQITFQLAKSASVDTPLSEALWSGGEDPPTGVGATFDTVFRLRLGGQTVQASLNDNGALLETSTEVRIYGIDSVEWIAFPDGGELVSGGGEYSVFPGWTPEDMELPEADRPDRTRVLVRVTLNEPLENVRVYLRVFDVDDPSASDGPIDVLDADGFNADKDDSDIDGGDNRGAAAWSTSHEGTEGSDFQYGLLGASVSKRTNAQGVCSVVLLVSLQPGDNFRVLASFDSQMITFNCDTAITSDETPSVAVWSDYDAEWHIFPDDEWPDRGTWPTEENLTVWRKLWVEADRMDITPKFTPDTKEQLVYSAEISTNSGVTATELQDTGMYYNWLFHPYRYSDDNAVYLRPNMAVNEYAVIAGPLQSPWMKVWDCYKVKDARPAGWNWMLDQTVDLTVMTTEGSAYGVYTEDEKIDPIVPPLGVAATAFAEAYVLVVPSPESGTVHPWQRNLTNGELRSIGDDNRINNPRFWNVFVLGAYEYVNSEDGDNDHDEAGEHTVGVTVKSGIIGGDYRYSSVFIEATRDQQTHTPTTNEIEKLTAHETGHQFEFDPPHYDGANLMNAELFWMTERFNDECLAQIRSCPAP